MKKIYLAALVALVSMWSCSDNMTGGIESPVDKTPSATDEVVVYVNLQKPGAGPTPYSTIWIDREADVDSLDVYVFSNKKARADKPGAYTLEKIVPQDTSRAASMGGNITLQLKLNGRTYDRKLYFIANGAKMNSLVLYDEIGWTSEDEFLSALTNNTLQQTPLLMTATAQITAANLAGVGADNKYVLTDDVELRRVAARIDIENHERLLIIDSVQLFNTPERSYITGQASTAPEDGKTNFTSRPAVNIRTHKLSDGAAVDSFWKAPVLHNDPNIGDSVYIPSIYFPYENFANGVDADRQKLRIWGRIGSGDLTVTGSGKPVTYEVALQAMGDSIARNHRYILLIHNVLGSDLNADLDTKPWESEEGDTIVYEGDTEQPIVTWNGNRIPDRTLDVAAAGGDFTLQVSCNTQWAFMFEGENAAIAPNWITPEICMEDGSTPAEGRDIGKSLHIIVEPNVTNAARGGWDRVWIKVYNKADPSMKFRFTIVQAAN